MSEVKLKIRTFLADELEVDTANLKDEEAMFTSGLVDSYALIELLSFLESELGYTVDFGELDVEDFDTIDSLDKLVSNQTAE
jgi:acyl carrier protein